MTTGTSTKPLDLMATGCADATNLTANDTGNSSPVPVPEAQPQHPGGPAKTLDSCFVHALVWTGSMKWAAQLLAWGATLILVRLLTPADYGLMGLVTVFMTFVTLASEFGIGSAIVVNDVPDALIPQLNAMGVLIGVLCLGIGCAAGKPLGWFFGNPKLPLVIVVMSLGFVFSGFATVPSSLLQKRLRFKALAGLDVLRALLTSGVSVGLAFAGWKYWSLVWGTIVADAIFTLLLVVTTPQEFAWPRFKALRNTLGVGTDILLNTLAWHIWSNADFMVAGRRLGVTPLGCYTISWNVASVPDTRVSAMISRVSPAFFSAVKADAAELRRYLLRLTEAISLIAMPAAVGLALVAGEFVPVVFGNQWVAAVLPLRLLALATIIRCVAFFVPQVLNVVGESRFAMFTSVATAIVLPGGFYVGSRWGIDGIAGAWLLAYPLMLIPNYWRMTKKIDLPVSELLGAFSPAAAGAAMMAVVVVLVHKSLPLVPQGVRLAAEVGTGALAYVSFIMAAYRERVISVWHTARATRG